MATAPTALPMSTSLRMSTSLMATSPTAPMSTSLMATFPSVKSPNTVICTDFFPASAARYTTDIPPPHAHVVAFHTHVPHWHSLTPISTNLPSVKSPNTVVCADFFPASAAPPGDSPLV